MARKTPPPFIANAIKIFHFYFEYFPKSNFISFPMHTLIWLVWNVNWPYFFLEMWRMPCNRMCARSSPENMCLIQDLSTLAFFNAREKASIIFLSHPTGSQAKWLLKTGTDSKNNIPHHFLSKEKQKNELSLQRIINIFQNIHRDVTSNSSMFSKHVWHLVIVGFSSFQGKYVFDTKPFKFQLVHSSNTQRGRGRKIFDIWHLSVFFKKYVNMM